MPIIPELITKAQNNSLVDIPSWKEIRNAVFSLDPGSVVGADRFNWKFYHHFWKIIGTDLTQAIIDIFRGGELSKGAK